MRKTLSSLGCAQSVMEKGKTRAVFQTGGAKNFFCVVLADITHFSSLISSQFYLRKDGFCVLCSRSI